MGLAVPLLRQSASLMHQAVFALLLGGAYLLLENFSHA